MGLIYVVTGASQSLGPEFVKQLSERGDTVIACAYQLNQSKQLRALVDGKNVHGVAIKTMDLESIEQATEQIQQLAPDGIDVLINNSGIFYNQKGQTIYSPASNYVKAFEEHIDGTFSMTQALVPLLRNRTTRAIVNISSEISKNSLSNKVKTTFTGSTAVNTTSDKTLEHMLTRDFAFYLGDEGFVVFTMCPTIQEPFLTSSERLKMDVKNHAQTQFTPEQSIRSMLLIIDKHSKDLNGAFVTFDDENLGQNHS